MTDETLARLLLIEQTRKELLDTIKQYQVGWSHDGEMLATKKSGDWNGFVFVIPDGKYKELWGEVK